MSHLVLDTPWRVFFFLILDVTFNLKEAAYVKNVYTFKKQFTDLLMEWPTYSHHPPRLPLFRQWGCSSESSAVSSSSTSCCSTTKAGQNPGWTPARASTLCSSSLLPCVTWRPPPSCMLVSTFKTLRFPFLMKQFPEREPPFFPALNMTSASSFQMLRGSVIIFTGLLSVAFLGRRLLPSQWFGICVTILGLVVVGLADFISGHRDDTHKLSDVITGKIFLLFLQLSIWRCCVLHCSFWRAGDLLIIMAQIIVSVQMVLEEKFVYKHDVHPLRAVGTEGTSL